MKATKAADLYRASKIRPKVIDYLNLPPSMQVQTKVWLATKSYSYQITWQEVEADVRKQRELELQTYAMRRDEHYHAALKSKEPWAVEWHALHGPTTPRTPAPTKAQALATIRAVRTARHKAARVGLKFRSMEQAAATQAKREWGSDERRRVRSLHALKRAFDKLKV